MTARRPSSGARRMCTPRILPAGRSIAGPFSTISSIPSAQITSGPWSKLVLCRRPSQHTPNPIVTIFLKARFILAGLTRRRTIGSGPKSSSNSFIISAIVMEIQKSKPGCGNSGMSPTSSIGKERRKNTSSYTILPRMQFCELFPRLALAGPIARVPQAPRPPNS